MGGDFKKKHKNKKKRKSTNQKDEHSSQNEIADDTQSNLEESENDIQTDTIESAKSPKRLNKTEDSDSEDEPKRKKKKKKPVAVEVTSDKKNKKSNRQIKKEKFAQRQAELQAAAKDQLKSQCISYLSQWKHDKANWKFMKAKQVWLYKNKFSQNLVPSESWPLLMEYFESAQGNIRNMLLEDANKIIKQMDDWTESQDKENDEETDGSKEITEIMKPDEMVYKRARDLIQCLQE